MHKEIAEAVLVISVLGFAVSCVEYFNAKYGSKTRKEFVKKRKAVFAFGAISLSGILISVLYLYL